MCVGGVYMHCEDVRQVSPTSVVAGSLLTLPWSPFILEGNAEFQLEVGDCTVFISFLSKLTQSLSPGAQVQNLCHRVWLPSLYSPPSLIEKSPCLSVSPNPIIAQRGKLRPPGWRVGQGDRAPGPGSWPRCLPGSSPTRLVAGSPAGAGWQLVSCPESDPAPPAPCTPPWPAQLWM